MRNGERVYPKPLKLESSACLEKFETVNLSHSGLNCFPGAAVDQNRNPISPGEHALHL